MSALVRSELLKIRTIRSWWAYLIVLVAFTAIAVAAQIGSADEGLDASTVDFQSDLVETAGIALLLAIILGITIVTTEFRFGTVTPTFLVAPQARARARGEGDLGGRARDRLRAPLARRRGAHRACRGSRVRAMRRTSSRESSSTSAGHQILSAVLWALLGVAIGTLVQSQVAALVGTLVWIFLGETLLLGLFGVLDVDGLSAYLPFRALDAADGSGGDDLLSYWPGVAVSLAWIGALGAAGVERTRRRDIT